VRIVEQLAVFLANKPGTLAEVCDALAADRVNIYGLTISDTVDHAVVRMVVSDTRRALAIFESRGTLIVETDVIMIENDNKPGSLSRIASILSTHRDQHRICLSRLVPTAKGTVDPASPRSQSGAQGAFKGSCPIAEVRRRIVAAMSSSPIDAFRRWGHRRYN
jgi:hypothetical protein